MPHHQTSATSATLNIRNALEYLIDNHTVHDINNCQLYSDTLIEDHLDDWMEFAAAGDSVNLFDSSSWPDSQDFTSFKYLFFIEITLMQMAGRVVQTSIEEKQCTRHAIMHISFMRPFNDLLAWEQVNARVEQIDEATDNAGDAGDVGADEEPDDNNFFLDSSDEESSDESVEQAENIANEEAFQSNNNTTMVHL